MPRPCAGAHAPSPQSCHLCKLVATRPDYAALWGEWSPSFAAGGCRHRGAELPGGAPLKTWACALHGRCHLTAGARLDGVTDCSRCPDRPRAVVCTADGIGDAVLGLLAAAGVARAHPAREVAYRVKPHQLPWVRLFGGYDRADATAGFGRDDPDAFYPHLTYGEQNAERLSRPRWEHYAAACGADAALPPVRPLPDAALRRAAGYRGAVVLCPRSQHGMRTWHLSHWLRLEAHLRGRGMRTVAIDSLPEPIAEFAGEKFVGLAPQEVAALMLASWCVVANDSGMAHVAGALGVPVVVVSGVIRGERLYGFYRHPRCVDGPLGCTGCHWHGPDYRRACDSVCASLQAVEPGEAAAAVDRAATSADFLDRVAAAGAADPLVVETGCQRGERDWGAGMSTTLFGRFLRRHGGRLLSLDHSPANVALARKVAAGLPVEVVRGDSRERLREYRGAPLAGLYLDSADVGTPGFEEVCLAEAGAALPKLLPRAPILIDDTWRDGAGWKGKGRLAVPWLVGRGWAVVRQGYQTLLARGEATGRP